MHMPLQTAKEDEVNRPIVKSPVANVSDAEAEGRTSKVNGRRARRAMIVAGAIVLLAASSALADLVGLPASGVQVNSDPAVGNDPGQSAGASDVVGGSLAGGARVPWATFEQKSVSSQQIFVRAFKNG